MNATAHAVHARAPAQGSPPNSASRAAGEVWRALLTYRREFALAGLFSAIANLLMLTPTLYMLQVYDRVMMSRNELTLLSVSLLTLVLFCVLASAEWMRSRLLVATGVRFDERLSSRVFDASFGERVSTLSAPGYQPGKAFGDLLQVRQFITGHGVLAFFDLPWVPIYIGVMFLLHPFLGWMSIAFAAVQTLLAALGHQRTLAPAEAAQQAHQDAQQYLNGKLRSAEVIETMGMAPHIRQQWWVRHQAAQELAASSQGQTHRMSALSKFIRYTQQSMSLGAGALLVVDGQLSPGAMIAANVLMSRALSPIDTLVATWRGFISARLAFGRLSALLADHPKHEVVPGREPLSPQVRMVDVSVVSPGTGRPILQNVNLDLPPGQVLVILGPSGSGKSTLARTVLGIWGEVQGEVFLGDQRVESWSRDELGPQVGYLPQDIELFEGTIAENIARLGKVDSEKVIAASRAAGLHDMILRMSKGYDTPVGEAASFLSAGQRQRLALARALYGRPRLVVLDEPNANLDEVGEAALARAVQELRTQGATVLMIAHRPGVIALADRMLLLSEGRIAMEGPRDVVLRHLRTPSPSGTRSTGSPAT